MLSSCPTLYSAQRKKALSMQTDIHGCSAAQGRGPRGQDAPSSSSDSSRQTWFTREYRSLLPPEDSFDKEVWPPRLQTAKAQSHLFADS